MASVATMGIPVAIEVTRRLGLDQYVIFHKTPKIHLADAIAEPVRSITTAVDQRLLLDRQRVGVVEGRRVALIDDVVSTGASAAAALRLLRRVGATPVAVGRDRHRGDGVASRRSAPTPTSSARSARCRSSADRGRHVRAAASEPT